MILGGFCQSEAETEHSPIIVFPFISNMGIVRESALGRIYNLGVSGKVSDIDCINQSEVPCTLRGSGGAWMALWTRDMTVKATGGFIR